MHWYTLISQLKCTTFTQWNILLGNLDPGSGHMTTWRKPCTLKQGHYSSMPQKLLRNCLERGVERKKCQPGLKPPKIQIWASGEAPIHGPIRECCGQDGAVHCLKQYLGWVMWQDFSRFLSTVDHHSTSQWFNAVEGQCTHALTHHFNQAAH